jgi:hypothetical protein
MVPSRAPVSELLNYTQYFTSFSVSFAERKPAPKIVTALPPEDGPLIGLNRVTRGTL